jgi:insulin-like growth factor 2 mRNA-binding protein 1
MRSQSVLPVFNCYTVYIITSFPDKNENETSVQVAYETSEQAQQAVDQLNGYLYQEAELHVTFARANGNPKGGMRMGPGGPQRNAMGPPGNGQRAAGSGYALK